MTETRTDADNVTVTENDTLTRDPATGEAVHTVERTVVRRDSSNWGLWVAGYLFFESYESCRVLSSARRVLVEKVTVVGDE